MLEIMRKTANSWLMKILLVIIALAFVLFIGVDLTSSQQNEIGNIATVNGKPISKKQFSYKYNQTLQNLGNNASPEILEFFKNNVLQSLINNNLVSQDFSQMGLSPTSQEQVHFIKNAEQFSGYNKNGLFDFEEFAKNELPLVLSETGQSLSEIINFEISYDRLSKQFKKVISLSEEDIDYFKAVRLTTREFEVIKVPTKEKKTNKEDVKNPDIFGLENANKIYEMWQKNPQKIDDYLKANNLQKVKSGNLKLSQLKSIFDGKEVINDIKSLLTLTEKNPFAQTPFATENFFYLVKLVNLNEPKEDNSEIKKQLTQNQNNEIHNLLSNAYIEYLQKNASIEIAK